MKPGEAGVTAVTFSAAAVVPSATGRTIWWVKPAGRAVLRGSNGVPWRVSVTRSGVRPAWPEPVSR